jgi:CRISPR-associated endonuclease/helicase Cas3
LVDAGSEWPAPVLSKTNFVYKDAALLWRSAKAIFTAGKIVSRTSRGCAACESGEIRALVEAVYGEGAPEIPPSLEEVENEALGVRSGERTQAHYNTLDFQKGYDWDGMKWERETRVKTRLGEETITLRLARVDAGRVVPWISTEEGDPRRAWALSEVSLRKSRCSGVLVLNPIDNERWQGTVRGKGANPARVLYSKSTGLQFVGSQ